MGLDTWLHSIFVISTWLLVAGCCRRHSMLSSNVIKINKSVRAIDVWHLVNSAKVLVHIIQKIVQALVFSYPASWNFLVTKSSTNNSVRTVMGIRIIASRFSVIRNLTCKGLASGIQKIVVFKCSPCKENGVHLQRMSAFKCLLLSPGRLRVFSNGFIEWSVNYSTRLVHAHNLRWRKVLEETFDKCKVCRFGGQEKVAFAQVSRFSGSIL